MGEECHDDCFERQPEAAAAPRPRHAICLTPQSGRVRLATRACKKAWCWRKARWRCSCRWNKSGLLKLGMIMEESIDRSVRTCLVVWSRRGKAGYASACAVPQKHLNRDIVNRIRLFASNSFIAFIFAFPSLRKKICPLDVNSDIGSWLAPIQIRHLQSFAAGH